MRLLEVPVMIQANPAFFVCLFQASSDLHVAASSIAIWGRWFLHVAASAENPIVIFSVWARFHSLTNLTPVVSSSEKHLPSKINTFRAFQRDQHIHKRILFEIPEGGRETAFLKATRAFLKSSPVVKWTTLWREVLLQTSLENGQKKKLWHADSFSLHLTQNASMLISLVCRFSPKGSVFWMIDHRKTRILGEKLPLRTYLIQLNTCSSSTTYVILVATE